MTLPHPLREPVRRRRFLRLVSATALAGTTRLSVLWHAGGPSAPSAARPAPSGATVRLPTYVPFPGPPADLPASTDMMIIRVRRRLLMAAHALADQGVIPPGVDDPSVFGARAGGVFLPKDADWLEATADLRRGFVKHADLDPSVTGPLV